METEQTYVLLPDEDYKDFLQRVFDAQPDQEPLRMLGVLAEIVVTELHGQPYHLTAAADAEGLTLTFTHEGKPIDGRMVKVIADSIADSRYRHDRQGRRHVMTLRCLFRQTTAAATDRMV